MSNKSTVIRLMGFMALAWPRYEIREGSSAVYYEMLKDIPDDTLETAAKHLATTCTFFPSIAEWRKAAFDILLNKPGLPSAYEAWEIVCNEIRRVGSYRQPEFDQPLVKRAVDILGWRELCLSESPEFDRAHFFKIYDSLLSRADEDNRLLPDVRQAMQAPRSLDARKSVKLLTEKMTAK